MTFRKYCELRRSHTPEALAEIRKSLTDRTEYEIYERQYQRIVKRMGEDDTSLKGLTTSFIEHDKNMEDLPK